MKYYLLIMPLVAPKLTADAELSSGAKHLFEFKISMSVLEEAKAFVWLGFIRSKFRSDFLE